MKKRLKLLSMLLISAIMINVLSPVTKVKAAITDLNEISEYPADKDSSYYDSYGSYLPNKLLLDKSDIGKMQKIIIPEYSYVQFEIESSSTSFSLYEDENKNNKIMSGYECNILLPKGEYYICIDNTVEGWVDFSSGKPVSKPCELRYGRISLDNLIKGSVTIVDKKKFTFGSGAFQGTYKETVWMQSDFDYHYYGSEYTYEFIITDGEKENIYPRPCYNSVTFTFSLKNKDSNISYNYTGETKEIVETENKGETYDLTKSTKNSSKKKDTKKPTVKGVKNNKTYKKSVKFKVSDKSGIKKVTLNKKKIKVSKAKKGYTVKKNGKYTLKVWDKAGNVRTVKFKIKK